MSLYHEKLNKSLEKWEYKVTDTMDENGKPFSLTEYSHIFSIPMITLANYIVGKVKVGARVVAKPIVSAESTRFLVDVIIRHYREKF